MPNSSPILFLLLAFLVSNPILGQEAAPRRARVSQTHRSPDDYIKGTVEVAGAHYLLTDRDLKELELIYRGLLKPSELIGKKVLDIGSGPEAKLVFTLRGYAKNLCESGKKNLRNASLLLGKGEKGKEDAQRYWKQGRLKQQVALGIYSEFTPINLGPLFWELGQRDLDYSEKLAHWAQTTCNNADKLAEEGAKKIDASNQGAKTGVEAYGIDLAIPEKLSEKVDFVKRGDAIATGYPDSFFDHAYSSWSIVTYEGNNEALMEQFFKETSRILKAGGTVNLTPVVQSDLPIIKKVLPPELTVEKVIPTHEIPRGTDNRQHPAVVLRIIKLQSPPSVPAIPSMTSPGK